MKKIFLILFLLYKSLYAQEDTNVKNKSWQVQLSFGEIPWKDSFKIGLGIGYHFSEEFYLGAIYQISDEIQRDNTSFNANSINLEGMEYSRESVGQRFLFHAQYKPIKYSPYVSIGFLFNDEDIETIKFDSQSRLIGNNTYNSSIKIKLQREQALKPAIGIGYSYEFQNGIQLNVEWTGAFLNKIPTPKILIESSEKLSSEDESILKKNIEKEFTSSIFNLYHVFHFGIGYIFGK